MGKVNFMKYIVFFIVLSCSTFPKRIIVKQTFFYNGKNTYLDSLLCINGCYYSERDNLKYGGGADSYIFYKNGLVLNTCIGYVMDFQDDLIEDIKDSFFDVSIGCWGKYKIKNDTITIELIEYPRLGGTSLTKLKMKIVNKKKLFVFDTNGYPYSPDRNITFKNFKKLPSSLNCWLLDKEWFWRDKEVYKKWMNDND
jgi:hypothetical protein